MSYLPSEVDVLIVGMGPVGAALAQLLNRYGTKTLVIDKSKDIFMAPRAIALDNEALRVRQMCGFEEDAIDTVAIPEVRMHSPLFVGQGLVAGLRDVANLAWKLSWVCHGRAHPQLLDTYDQERRPHAKAMIDLAKLMGRLVMPSNHAAAFVAHGVMSTLSRIPRLKRLFENLEIKPANRFKAGCFAKPARGACLRRGGQMPQAWLRPGSGGALVLRDDVLGTGLVMVGFGVDPSGGLSPALIRAWAACGGSFVQINPRGPLARPSTLSPWEDLCGSLMPSTVPVDWVAIVRPDKVVMHDGPCTQAATLLEHAMGLFAQPTGTRAATVAAVAG